MKLRTLGRTGIKVSPYCLGAMMFGLWGNRDHDDCARIIHYSLDHGLNFIDTADMYSQGESEEIVGKALKGRRDEVVLATKVHGQMGKNPLHAGNSRRWIVEEVENSLRRLQTDYIDLYQIHRPDPSTDIEETLGALTDLVHAGKVRTIGQSTFPAELMVEAQWVAERRGYERFRCDQPPYSIFARGIEAAVLPTCLRYGMGAIVWSPLSGGWLSGKYRKGKALDTSSGRASLAPQRFDPETPANARRLDLVEQLVEIADDAGCSLTHLAMAFSIAHPAVTASIIGPRTFEQTVDLIEGASVVLDDDTLDRIDAVCAPGTDVDASDALYGTIELTDVNRRRLPLAKRKAAE